MVDVAPDRGERVAVAEIDAADVRRMVLPPLSREARRDHAFVQVGEDQAFERFEGTLVFLAKPGVAEAAAFLGGAGIGAGASGGSTHPTSGPWAAKTGSPQGTQAHHQPMGEPWVVVLELVLAPVEVQPTPGPWVVVLELVLAPVEVRTQAHHQPMGAPWVVVLELVLAPVEVQDPTQLLAW